MDHLKLWYRQPAEEGRSAAPQPQTDPEIAAAGPPEAWEAQALPVGNGAMGAMIFGGVEQERIPFNEKSLWTGGPASKQGYSFGNRPGAAACLPQVRALVRAGRKEEALSLAQKELTGDARGFGSYQAFGTILLNFPGHSSPQTYCRALDLERAVSRVCYTLAGTAYRREAFCSYPDQVLAVRLTADAPGALTVSIRLEAAQPGARALCAANTLVLAGELWDNGMAYEAQLMVLPTGGRLAASGDGALHLYDADEAVLLLACGTDYQNAYPGYKGRHPHREICSRLHRAAARGWPALLRRHQRDYGDLFGRVALHLGGGACELPTDELQRQYAAGRRNGLEELMFYYGRYLLIASSRPGSLPANLQGVWNASNTPPWCCDYHCNINLQMNYWPAAPANLAECAEPLLEYAESLRAPGRVSAREHFGTKRGWVVNTMNNPFGYTAPGWQFTWGWAPNSAAFLCQNLWEQYRYSADPAALRRIYPILREAAEFWADFLTEDSDGTLVSMPSYSPEHGACEAGCAMDQQLAAELFRHVIELSGLLGCDEDLRSELAAKLARLSPPLRIGSWGQLQEWKEDLDDPRDHHRHASHLVGLYPGDEIARTGEGYRRAARISLEARGDASTGWSRAWKIGLWARLKDGAHAYRLLRGQLKSCTYPNLLDIHPPFQIDGNFGYVAGVCEMLVQSWGHRVELLPALPPEWQTGWFRGLRARGGFELSARWERGRLLEAEILSHRGGVLRLELPGAFYLEKRGAARLLAPDGEGTAALFTEKGERYSLRAAPPQTAQHGAASTPL